MKMNVGKAEQRKTECGEGETKEDRMWARRDKGRQNVGKEGQRKTECGKGGTKEDRMW